MHGDPDSPDGSERRRPAESLEDESPAERPRKTSQKVDDPEGLRDFVEKLDEAVYVTTPDGTIVDGNPALLRILGAASLDELRDMRISDFLVDPDARRELDRRLASAQPGSGTEFMIRGLNRRRRWVRDASYAQRDSDGEIAAYRGMLIDITEDKRTVHALRDSEEKYRSIFENVQDIYYRLDLQGTIIEASPTVERYLGYKREELIGIRVGKVYLDSQDCEILRDRVLNRGEVTGYEISLERKDSTRIWFSVNARLLVDEHGKPHGFEGLLRDITDRKDLERRLQELSVRDPLTGCYNRRYLEGLRSRLERPTSRWGCLLLDLDDFKAVNDTYGHEEGDRVLQGVAHFVRRHGRAEDVVVRLGGDEFAIFVAAASHEELESIAERLREVAPLESPAPFSLGLAFRELGERIEDVVARADRSMYENKGRRLQPPARPAGSGQAG
jgi:diguanylate cyclase (GGDEF)-like protein/PAS domain S-box-containing protein